MKGQTAVVVLIIAMMITAGFGFFANFEKKNVEKTEYNLIGSMDAFFSANSTPTPQSEIFNSTYNITGWSGDIDTTNTVLPPNRTNQYVFKEESTDYKSFMFSDNYANHGYIMSGHYTGESGDYDTNWTSEFFKTSLSDSQLIYMYSGSIVPNPDNPTPGELYYRERITGDLTYYGSAMGGYAQTTYFEGGGGTSETNTFSLTFNDVDANSGFFVTDLNTLINNNPDWCVLANGKIAYADDHSPMIYDTESDALQKRNEYSALYPDKTWTYRAMTVADYTTNTRLYVNSGAVGFVANPTFQYVWTHHESGGDRYVDGVLKIAGTVSNNVSYLRYNQNNQHWVAYSDNGTPDDFRDDTQIWDSGNVGVYSNSPNAFQLQVRQYYVIPAVYFDPTRYVGIVGNADWSNYLINQSLVNTQITVLWKGTGTIQLNDDGPVLDIINAGGTYSIRTSPSTVVPLGTYKGLEITFTEKSKEVQIRGILNEQVNADNIPSTYDYLPASIGYSVGLYDNNPSDTNIPSVPEYIYELHFTSSNGYAYILETYILTDPNNLLWTNIDIDLTDYFEEYSDKMRVLFQGFVRYGDHITINGERYTVTNSGITVTVTEIIEEETNDSPAVVRTRDVKFNLNGMAIDYFNGHVYLNQTNGNVSVDLGEIRDYIINMEGIWFFSSSLSTINTYWGTENVWNPGWDMDMNTTLLLWIAVVVAISVLLMMRFRDMLDWEDMVILIFAVIVPLVMVVA